MLEQVRVTVRPNALALTTLTKLLLTGTLQAQQGKAHKLPLATTPGLSLSRLKADLDQLCSSMKLCCRERQAQVQYITDAENKYFVRQVMEGGLKFWNQFTNLINSSTRTEIGAAMGALLPKREVNFGIRKNRSWWKL